LTKRKTIIIIDVAMDLPKEYYNLNAGDKIVINGDAYTIKEKISEKAADSFHSDITRYELGNGYVLEYDWDWRFFKIEEKNLLGIRRLGYCKSRYIEVKDIKLT